jgi:hypothetical protein
MNKKKASEFFDVVKKDSAAIVEFLKCKLCKGIYKDPHTISECNHSFCKSCIFKYIEKFSQISCPTCKLISSPSNGTTIIRDLSLDRFVEIIFPEFKILDEREEVYFH